MGLLAERSGRSSSANARLITLFALASGQMGQTSSSGTQPHVLVRLKLAL